MTEISDSLRTLLARQDMRGNEAGTSALHVMGWANALLDREEEIDADHSPAGGEEFRRFENSGKGPDAEAPGQVGVGNKQPSPGRHTRPVLRLVHTSSRRRPTRYVIGPRLVLINGGKA